MKTLIVTGGSIIDYNWTKDRLGYFDYIICVDGGVRHLNLLRIMPNVILGDFDSADIYLVEKLVKKNITKIIFPTKKNKTDTEIAIDYALEKGADSITIVGGIGTRIDHTLANINLLCIPLMNDIYCEIINEHNRIFLINSSRKIHNDFGKYVSLMPLTTEVLGITTKGLHYPLNNYTLKIGNSLGISNEIVDNEAEIYMKTGILIVIQSRD